MFIKTLAINQDVIKVYNYKLIKPFAKQDIHGSLKSCRSISKTEGHHNELIVPIPGPECSLMLIFGTYLNLVLAGLRINLTEVSRSLQLVQKVIYTW